MDVGGDPQYPKKEEIRAVLANFNWQKSWAAQKKSLSYGLKMVEIA